MRCLLFCCALLFSNYSMSSSNQDLTPPQLIEFEISPKTIDVSSSSQQVTVLMRITDNESGVKTPTVSAGSDINDASTGILNPVSLLSGDNLDGVWQATLTVPQATTSGAWSVSVFPLSDNAENSGGFGPGSQFDNSFTVVSGSLDTIPPELIEFEVSPKTIDVSSSSQQVTVLMRITDNESGVKTPTVSAGSDINDASTGILNPVSLLSGDNLDGVWQATLTVPQATTSGGWSVSVFPLSDNAENSGGFGPGSQFDNNFTVVSGSLDTIPPQLVEFEVSPKTIDVSSSSQQVTVLMRITDNESGVKTPTVSARSDINDASTGILNPVSLLSGDNLDGIWQAILTVPQGTTLGNWTVSVFPLSDNAENTGEFGPGSQFDSAFVTYSDKDGDGIDDNLDSYPLVAIGELLDTDVDGAPNDCNQACVDLGMAADSDDDNDGLADSADFYPLVAIGQLLDTDGDGAPNDCDESCVALGMAADTDDDNDGLADSDDFYPLVAIGELLDSDNDGAPNDCDESCVALGMGADLDDDNDGLADSADTYPLVAIGDLIDTDVDGAPNDCNQACVDLGMAADSDDDNDGLADSADFYPLVAIGQLLDTDGDGAPNDCDESCVALGMAADPDNDNDGLVDSADTYPLVAIGELIDTDGDGAPNDCDESCVALGMAADPDNDNDGLVDSADAYSLVAIGDLLDSDGDGAPNDCDDACQTLGMSADSDDDNDGIVDVDDAFTLIAIGDLLDTDNDGAPNECDDACQTLGMSADSDDDNDGIADIDDAFALIAIGDLLDTDNDGAPNECDEICVELGMTADLDDDNDGIADVDDALPLDASESLDTDLDGAGNNADNDDDEDGLPDTYELANGLNPLDASDGALDNDSDGLSNYDEFRIGTNIDSTDTDSDGIDDSIDNNPLDFDEPAPTLYTGKLSVLPDLNDDGFAEMGILKVDREAGQVTLEVLSGKDQSSLKVISWTDSFEDSSLALHVIPDMNDNGTDEVGLFGIQDVTNNEGKSQMFVRDLQTGNRVNVYNWPANWKEVRAMVVTDISGDGIADIGLQGRFKDGNRPQLVVKNGDNSSNEATFTYPDLFNAPMFYQHSDVDGDGFEEIATFGVISRNDKIQVKIANGINPNNKLKAYNFPDKWSNVSWHRLDDSNGDGIDDWGLFGISKADGRPQLINKDGTNPRGALRIYAWIADMNNAQFYRIPDMNNDGVDEVAAAGRRGNGRYQFQVQDGADRNSVLANHNLNLKLESLTFHVLPDLSGDEKAEIGFLGINTNGEYELVIQHGNAADGEFDRINLGSDWQSAPSITSLGDTDDDGLPDLLIYGQNATGEQLVITSL